MIIHSAVRKGNGTATPLLLMNGIGARLELLQPFVDAISDDRDVIRFDIPGVGTSPVASKPYRFFTMARAIGDMLDDLGYPGEVDVLGISWGGALAQQFAFSQRKRTRRLILVSTSPGMVMIPAHPKVLVKMATSKRYRDPEFMAQAAGDLYGGTMRVDPDLVIEAITAAGADHGSRGYYMQLLCGIGWTSLPFLRAIKAPTLVLSGNDDPLIRLSNARLLNLMLPNSTLDIFEGGHLGLVTEATEIAPRIEAFLNA